MASLDTTEPDPEILRPRQRCTNGSEKLIKALCPYFTVPSWIKYGEQEHVEQAVLDVDQNLKQEVKL